MHFWPELLAEKKTCVRQGPFEEAGVGAKLRTRVLTRRTKLLLLSSNSDIGSQTNVRSTQPMSRAFKYKSKAARLAAGSAGGILNLDMPHI
jgi:hypothetical protein